MDLRLTSLNNRSKLDNDNFNEIIIVAKVYISGFNCCSDDLDDSWFKFSTDLSYYFFSSQQVGGSISIISLQDLSLFYVVRSIYVNRVCNGDLRSNRIFIGIFSLDNSVNSFLCLADESTSFRDVN